MKLVKLTLKSWRGVDHREIDFADEVTLIEGPNEIGKSTIVEAIHTLFKEMDSSNKQSVKAIQPVGEDLGSEVEAEIITGDYHFVYAKTYNKGKQTSLKILAPRAEQLTGREAHERASQILDETIDTVLFDALLVEQGEKVAGANLSDSSGLARALDAAAGTSSESSEDSALFTAVQREYEGYFTAKAGKSKYADQEKALQALREEVASARSSLAEVEADSTALAREKAEVKRLADALPGLESKVTDHEAAWRKIEALGDSVRTREAELDAAEELYKAADADLQRRLALVEKCQKDQLILAERRAELEPSTQKLEELQQAHDLAANKLREAKQNYQAANILAKRTISDEKHLANVEALAKLETQLAQIAGLDRELSAARGILAGIKMDPEKLGELRTAERKLQVAQGRRDASALQIKVSAERQLQLEINDEQVVLVEGQSESRSTAAELNLHIPGVAAVLVSPSRSATELEAEWRDSRTQFDTLLADAGVGDLAEAVAVEETRTAAAQEVVSCSQKIAALLDGELLTARQTAEQDLATGISRYVAERPEQPVMPQSLREADAASSAAQQMAGDAEETMSSAQEALDEAWMELESRRGDFRVAEEELRGLEDAARRQQKLLGSARAETADEDLAARVQSRKDQKTALEADLGQLQQQLDGASPEAAKTLLDNARNTLRRAAKDLKISEQRCAVLEDRLTKAQADGRFEALENAEYRLENLEAQHAATSARAAAARRLWETVSRHRDNARKAYVKPLKEGIENLGKIVFGADFEVELDDEWKLVSRTQAGRTIPFDDLSVGAKEQLGILTRLAAAGVVARQGGVPLIIDDALGFSDPGRLESMGAAIASAGRDCQIILLTCTPGRFMHVGNAVVVRL